MNKTIYNIIDKPKFSVIMANYNKEEYIREAIESVLNQTFRDWELIIIDDKSTDNSIKIIQKYLIDERIRLIKNCRNIGRPKTLIRLVNNIKSDLFGVLDSDDTISTNALSIMYDAHNEHNNCGFIYSQFMYCNERLSPLRKGYCRKMPIGSTNLRENYSSAFRTFKKEVYFKTEGFNDELILGEDRDIIYKMEEVTRLFFVDRILYKYRIVPLSNAIVPNKINIGRCSSSMMKYNAFLRRKNNNNDFPSLTNREMGVELFIGMIFSFKLKDINNAKLLLNEAVKLNKIILLDIIVYTIAKFFNKL